MIEILRLTVQKENKVNQQKRFSIFLSADSGAKDPISFVISIVRRLISF